MEAESELKEDQLLEDEVEEVASFSVFQIAEGCDFQDEARYCKMRQDIER